MSIVLATPDDADALTAIAFAGKRSWGYPEAWIEGWRDQLTVTPAFIRAHETYAFRVDDRFVGFHSLGRTGATMELVHCWVLPEWQRRGIGRSLFHHAVARVRSLGVTEFEIEADPGAEGFYARLGACRVRLNHYRLDGAEREVPVMRYRISMNADP